MEADLDLAGLILPSLRRARGRRGGRGRTAALCPLAAGVRGSGACGMDTGEGGADVTSGGECSWCMRRSAGRLPILAEMVPPIRRPPLRCLMPR